VYDQAPNPFAIALESRRLELRRTALRCVQINVGLNCDLACRHCHLAAGPNRHEQMSRATMAQVIELVGRTRPPLADVTGGAPERNPEVGYLLAGLADAAERVILRSNLTALAEPEQQPLLELCRRRRIGLVASFPSLNAGQAEAQRGDGTHQRSLEMLRRLNDLGYGRPGTGLELNLAMNPTGAFLPPGQVAQERRAREEMARRWGIEFTHLFNFTNAPLGRFRQWLEQSGNYAGYMERLRSGFNPDTLAGVMCRHQISIAWDGCLYDCDFNLAAGIPQGGKRRHVSEVRELPGTGCAIATGEHCFACTAGAGFTCGGEIAG